YVAYGTSMSRKPPRRLLRLAPVFLLPSPSTPRAVFPGSGFLEPPPGGRILAGTEGWPAGNPARAHPRRAGVGRRARVWLLCLSTGGQVVNRKQPIVSTDTAKHERRATSYEHRENRFTGDITGTVIPLFFPTLFP